MHYHHFSKCGPEVTYIKCPTMQILGPMAINSSVVAVPLQ